ncbi:MAG: ankyrin repeat domain-containing protein [Candidatus Eremiobacteraeota bacterium]|nr:ankyrin repeat domain-containing protein [Candidatus Eremiobacteraeota bacterium]
MSSEESVRFIGAVIFSGLIIYALHGIFLHMARKRGGKPAKGAPEPHSSPRRIMADDAVCKACEEGDISALEALLYKDRQLVHAKDRENLTALHRGVMGGFFDVVKLLIEKGAFIDAEDMLQRTPLHHAALRGDAGIAQLLVSAGAQVNKADVHGETPLHDAAKAGSEEIATMLIKAGSDVDAETSVGNLTPWESAMAAGHRDLAKLLHERSSKKKDHTW